MTHEAACLANELFLHRAPHSTAGWSVLQFASLAALPRRTMQLPYRSVNFAVQTAHIFEME